jgi:hypothetical protein
MSPVPFLFRFQNTEAAKAAIMPHPYWLAYPAQGVPAWTEPPGNALNFSLEFPKTPAGELVRSRIRAGAFLPKLTIEFGNAK